MVLAPVGEKISELKKSREGVTLTGSTLGDCMHAFMSASEQRRLLRIKKVTARDLLEEYLARVDRYDVALNAIVWQDRAKARQVADAIEPGDPRPYFDPLFRGGLFGVAYLPATAIPVMRNAEGLPLGVQIVGPAYGDRITIGVARLLEDAGFRFISPSGYET